MPKSTGFSAVAGNVPPSCSVRPKRASFRSPAPNSVRFVHRQRALRDRAALAESGNVGALRGRLDAGDLLAPEEHLQAIARAGVVPHVHGPGVLVDPGVGRADEPRRAVGIEVVGARDQRDQLPDDRIGRRRPLRVARAPRLFMSMPCRCRRPS